MIESFNCKAGEIVDEDQHDHHRKEPHLTPGIEHQATDKQSQVFQLVGGNVIQRQCDRQKAEQKQNGTEQQACDTPLQKRPVPPSGGTGQKHCLGGGVISALRPERCRWHCSPHRWYWQPPLQRSRPAERYGHPWQRLPYRQTPRTGRRWRCWSCRLPYRS